MSVGAQAVEFWSTLADIEYERLLKGGNSSNYISGSSEFLFDLVLNGIQRLEAQFEDDLDDEWGVDKSSGTCLIKMSKILKNDVIQPVLTFAEGLIKSEDWKGRYSALRALGCISEGPER